MVSLHHLSVRCTLSAQPPVGFACVIAFGHVPRLDGSWLVHAAKIDLLTSNAQVRWGSRPYCYTNAGFPLWDMFQRIFLSSGLLVLGSFILS